MAPMGPRGVADAGTRPMALRLGAQLEALDFAGRGLRQLGAELDPARIFVGRELLAGNGPAARAPAPRRPCPAI